MTTNSLPPPDQTWSHGTNSLASCLAAMQDDSITAIEADIVMGRVISAPDTCDDSVVPIMSHPPIHESDLSASIFLDHATKGTSGRNLNKHLKLDFKDFKAVEPTLEAFKNLKVKRNGNNTVFLNADVLEGPGKSSDDVTVPADEFVQKCLELVESEQQQGGVPYAFSLGFKVEVHSPWGHTDDHLQSMADLVERHNLTERCAGVVLAINARLLYKNTLPFESFLNDFPGAQILAWSGSTEPPISSRKVNAIRNRFAITGHSPRVGFDCNVADTLLHGFVWDLAVDVYGLYVIFCKLLGLPSMSASYKRKQA